MLYGSVSLSLAAHPRRLHMYAVGNDVELLLAEQQKWSCLQALSTVRRRVCVWRCLKNIYKLSRNFAFACLHENCFDDGGKLLFVSFETKWMFVIGRHQCSSHEEIANLFSLFVFVCFSGYIYLGVQRATAETSKNKHGANQSVWVLNWWNNKFFLIELNSIISNFAAEWMTNMSCFSDSS